jgi:hypothetical protein
MQVLSRLAGSTVLNKVGRQVRDQQASNTKQIQQTLCVFSASMNVVVGGTTSTYLPAVLRATQCIRDNRCLQCPHSQTR